MRSVEPSHQPPIYIIPQKKQIYFDNRKNLKKIYKKRRLTEANPSINILKIKFIVLFMPGIFRQHPNRANVYKLP